jgi:hypothetical protein
LKKILLLGSLCTLALSMPLASRADTLDGSASFAISVTGTNGSGSNTSLDPINSVTSIDWSGAEVFGTGTGQLGDIPGNTDITGSTSIFPSGPNGGNGTAFTLTFGDYGTFTETVDPQLIVEAINRTSSRTILYLLGTFTPGPSFSGFDPNDASIIISFTNTGGVYSGSGTLSTPAASFIPIIPEPSSLVLFGTGMLGGVGLLRRRRQ